MAALPSSCAAVMHSGTTSPATARQGRLPVVLRPSPSALARRLTWYFIYRDVSKQKKITMQSPLAGALGWRRLVGGRRIALK